MANRDKTQGFGFVYVDVSKLLRSSKDGEPVFETEAMSINLNKDPWRNRETTPETTKTSSATTAIRPPNPTANPVAQVAGKLDRLSALHHKLHVLLEELNNLTKKK